MAMLKGINFRVGATDHASPALRKVTGNLNNLRRVSRSTGIANARMAESLGGSTVRRHIQQAGMQVSDFSVQVAGGQSAILAFTQNAPQFLQNFGAMGGVIGAAVTILGTFAFMASRAAEKIEEAAEKAKTFEEVLDEATSAVAGFRSIISDTSGTLTSLTSEYGTLNDDTREFIMLQRELQQLTAIKEIGQSFDRLLNTTDMQKATGDLGGVAADILEARRALEQVQSDFGKGSDETLPFIENLREVESAYSSLETKLAETPTLGIMNASETFASALGAENVDEMNNAIITMRKHMQDLPKPLQAELLPTIIQMEAATRGLARGVADSSDIITDSSDDLLAKYRANITLERQLLGMSETRADVMRTLGEDAVKYTNKQIEAVVGLAEAYAAEKQQLDAIHGRTQDIADTISGGIDNALMSVLDSTKTFGEKMRGVLGDILTELYRVLVVQQVVGGFNASTGQGTGLVGAIGKRWGGNFASFEGGGNTGPGVRAGGVDGRGGRMAILHPNETISDHAKGGSAGVTVIQNNSFGDGVTASQVQAMLPALVEATKRAIADANARKVSRFA